MNQTRVASRSRVSPHLGAAVLLALAGLLAGCFSLKPAKTETRYFLLSAVRPAAETGQTNASLAGCVVRLRPVQIADYLNTRSIAVRGGTNQVHFALFDCWAEPLDSGIRRVLAEDLRAEPGIRDVVTEETPPDTQRVYTVYVHVLACEGVNTNRSGSTAFEAVWEVTGSGSQGSASERGVFRSQPTAWKPGDYGELASQTSRALGELSGVLTEAIARLSHKGAG
ncbi:MAG TPA: PqiC family protein [Candidatus Acidoferrum sp.]|nr:PqiC family protein [Candidatus Acidoferrum sp.]